MRTLVRLNLIGKMDEFEDFPDKVWWELDSHFMDIMLMECTFPFGPTYPDLCERTYRDGHIILMIEIKQEQNGWKMRVNISSQKRFSGSVSLENLDSIVDKIYNLVLTQGGDNKDILNEWREIKKPEIRDNKINNLLK